MKKKLYLDVDGVLLTTKNTKAAPGSAAFLDVILSNFDCYWLTTHCKDGKVNMVLDRLAKYYPANIIKKLQVIKPTTWNTSKTEGIDFDSDFFWLDDYVFTFEKKILASKGCTDRLLLVDLNRENELMNICSKYLS